MRVHKVTLACSTLSHQSSSKRKYFTGLERIIEGKINTFNNAHLFFLHVYISVQISVLLLLKVASLQSCK